MGDTRQKASLHQALLFAIYNHPSGFFWRLEGSWAQQSNIQPPKTADLPGDEIFQFNAYAGFRFRRNHGDITLAFLNITDQDYKLNPLNYYNELPRERTLAVRVRLKFREESPPDPCGRAIGWGFDRFSTRKLRHLVRGLTILAGAALAIGIGLVWLRYSFAEPIIRLSYDVPFLWRTQIETHEVVLVYLDDPARQLNQQFDIWDRNLHVRLLDRLTQDQARLVFYDVIFDQPGPQPASDAAFAESIRRKWPGHPGRRPRPQRTAGNEIREPFSTHPTPAKSRRGVGSFGLRGNGP